MLSFKQYLQEDNNNFEFWPKEDVLEWSLGLGGRIHKKYNLEGFLENSIDNPEIVNGMLNAESVIFSGDTGIFPRIGDSELRHLPFQFGTITKNFIVLNCDLGSLKGCPKKVHGKFNIASNKNITSIEYLPAEMDQCILRGTQIKSLSGISKIIKKCRNIILPSCIETSILDLLKIPNLVDVTVTHIDKTSDDVYNAVEILNRHLDSKNILKCQRELIQNGLKEYAKF